MKPTFTGQPDRFISTRWGTGNESPRRTGHGGMPWISVAGLRQPQDGAQDSFTVAEMPSPRVRGSLIRMNEPEDAGLTGTTRSLGRRLLGLNVAVVTQSASVREAILPKRVLVSPAVRPQVA
jgi:hypothetical protein